MKFFFSLSILLLAVSCGTIKPKQPQVTENKIQLEQKVSTIHVPIEINLKNYLVEAEKQTPKKFEDEKQECEGISFWYKLERNPLAFDGKENQLFLDLSGKYSIKINYCPKCTGLFSDKENCIVPRLYASCGVNEPMRRIQVSTATTLSVNKDYKIDANTTLKNIVTDDKCEITVFKYDATKKLVDEMEKALKDVTADIDKKIEQTDLKKEVQKIWKELNNPIVIPSIGYFYLSPTTLAISSPNFSKDKLNLTVSVNAFPKVTLEEKKINNTPLPDLNSSTGEKGFEISLAIQGKYNSINSLLAQNLNGKEIQLKKEKIKIDSVLILGANNQKLSFKVCFSGKRSGLMYFAGTPKFDKEKQIISFPDMDFDIETKSVLLKSATWLFDDQITSKIREFAVYDVSKDLNSNKKMIEKELNRELDKGILMETKLKSVRIDQIIPMKEELWIVTNLEGELGIKL
jgi:hypothetical protein